MKAILVRFATAAVALAVFPGLAACGGTPQDGGSLDLQQDGGSLDERTSPLDANADQKDETSNNNSVGLLSDAAIESDSAPAPVGDVQRADIGAIDASGVDDTYAGCPVETTAAVGPRAARSGGYNGTPAGYASLYSVTCTTIQQCTETCMAAGGSTDSCTTGSECSGDVMGQPSSCLPPTYWTDADFALSESTSSDGAALQILVSIQYHDPLVLADFGVPLPSGSRIQGIQFDIRESANAGMAIDDSVRILRDGQPVGSDRRRADVWGADLEYRTYGGPTDTWDTTWTDSDLQSKQFGLSIAARYTGTAGNCRAYVDFVRVTVYYTKSGCDG